MSFSNSNYFPPGPNNQMQYGGDRGENDGTNFNSRQNQTTPPASFGTSPTSFNDQGISSNYQFANPWQPLLAPQNPHQFTQNLLLQQHLQQKHLPNLQSSPQQLSPPQQRRPSSLDSMNIWSVNHGGSVGSVGGAAGSGGGSAGGANSSIWSTYHRGSTGSSIGEFIPVAQQLKSQQANQAGAFEHKKSIDESASIFDSNFRMHNYADELQAQQYPQKQHQLQQQQQQQQFSNISPRFQNVLPLEAQQAQHSQLDKQGQNQAFQAQTQPVALTDVNLNAIHDYFLSDSHERVRVTLKLLQERFVEEQKYLNDTYQLPNFPVENSLRNYQLALIGFKAGRIDVFYLPMNQNEFWIKDLKIGDLVIVEADRGRDLGKIFKLNVSIDEARLMKLLQFQEQQAALSDLDLQINSVLSIRNFHQHSNPPTLHFPKPVIGLALKKEISQIINKEQDEEKACRLCLTKIANTTTIGQKDLLQMKLIDAEYQFDRKKLIFYYSTSKRIDFRDLVRELFRIYKTRIWMCAVIGLPYVPNQGNSQQQKIIFTQPDQSQKQQQLQQQQQQHQQQQNNQQQSNPVPRHNSMSYFEGGNNAFSQSFNQFQYFEPNQMKDLFKYQGQYFQPQSQFFRGSSISFDRRLSEPDSEDGITSVANNRSGSIGSMNDGNIPRKFKGYETERAIEDKNDTIEEISGGESSFVLQSLVDSIDH